MVWPQILGAAIGGGLSYLGSKQDRKALENANAQNNQYINAAMPYITNQLGNMSSIYTDMAAKGAYDGDFYAAPNNMQTDANNQLNFIGKNNQTLGNNIMQNTQGFVNNTNDLYNQYQNMVNRPDMMAEADTYAQNNMSPIVKAMMRDETRQLEEQTLPGINMNASGGGNTNSSRAGVASAIAERGYSDRLADVSTDVYNSLRDARLSQANTEFGQSMDALSGAGTANTALGNAFDTGVNLESKGVTDALTAGNNQQTWDQGQLDADRQQFDYQNNYLYNLGKDYMGFLTGNNIQGNYAANYYNPTSAAISGAVTGAGMFNPNNPMYDPYFGGGSGWNINWGA